MTNWIKNWWGQESARVRAAGEWRRWRSAVMPRGRWVVDWMTSHSGPIRLTDDDAAAVVAYVDWLMAEAQRSDGD